MEIMLGQKIKQNNLEMENNKKIILRWKIIENKKK